jgi:ParB family chromosome partitioning protein
VPGLLNKTGTVQSSADYARLGYVKSLRNSDTWNTPQYVVDCAREVLKGIDLDPFSSEEANRVIRADRYFTPATNAFHREWWATSVWMNPPYSARLIGRAVGKFLAEYQAGHFARAIVLTNNATETRWFQFLLAHASSLLLTNHRIAFWNTDGKLSSQNTRGQVLFYFGDDEANFATAFVDFGPALSRWISISSGEATATQTRLGPVPD